MTRAGAGLFLAVLVVAALGAGYLAVNSGRQASNSSSTTTTLTPSVEVEPNGSLLLSKTWGPWVYEVSVNSTSVRAGGALLLLAQLTYHGRENTTVAEVEPINSVSVYNSTGGQVWEYTPSEVTFEATVTPGEALGGFVCIPITTTPPAPSAQNHNCDFPFRQPVPGAYSIEAAPIFYSSLGNTDLGDNLQVTANFTVF